MARVAILGTGRVGKAIATGLAKNHEVRFGSRDPGATKVPSETKVLSLKEAARWADVAILAVPYTAAKEVIDAAGPDNLRGKTLIDVTNPLTGNMDLAVGFHSSAAEEIAKLAPGARVVKAFNTVFAPNMSTGRVGSDRLTLFVAGDDPQAKHATMALGRDSGFEPLDAGPLSSARYLEPMALNLMKMSFGQKLGTGIGFRLVGAPKKRPIRLRS